MATASRGSSVALRMSHQGVRGFLHPPSAFAAIGPGLSQKSPETFGSTCIIRVQSGTITQQDNLQVQEIL